MTTTRPTLAPKQTRASAAKKKAAMDSGISITIDERTYVVREGDITALDSRALRQEVGMTFPKIIAAMQDDPDLDLVAALVWLARRLEGERNLAFDDVASELNYSHVEDLKIGNAADEEVDESDPS